MVWQNFSLRLLYQISFDIIKWLKFFSNFGRFQKYPYNLQIYKVKKLQNFGSLPTISVGSAIAEWLL